MCGKGKTGSQVLQNLICDLRAGQFIFFKEVCRLAALSEYVVNSDLHKLFDALADN